MLAESCRNLAKAAVCFKRPVVNVQRLKAAPAVFRATGQKRRSVTDVRERAAFCADLGRKSFAITGRFRTCISYFSKSKEQPAGQQRMTTLSGCPIAHIKNSLTAGPTGPVLLQDAVLLEKLQQFDRERTPPRNVHALGAGAYGVFTATNPDIMRYTCASLFSQKNKQTPIFVRMSGIFTEQGDAETMRDPRGFAIKFYTDQGIWDLLAINTPVFNVRDGKLGPDAVHAHKRDPRTGMWNPTQTWDYIVNHPESLHMTLMLYSDKCGTPMSYRHMHAFGCNTFSFYNEKKERFWVKFHIISPRQVRGFDQAKLIAGEDPNFLSRDLYEAINKGDFPKWRLCCQIMPEAEGYKHPWTFDCTKVWKHADYPLIELGTIELNRNPTDYFSEVEQVAFSPARVVPGIGFSPDKLLQARLFIYDDTQYHRLGPNYKQLPINRPVNAVNTQYVGGQHNETIKQCPWPHYYPSSFGGPQPDERFLEPPMKTDGAASLYNYKEEGSDWDYYGQPREFYEKVMSDTDKEHLAANIATSIAKIPEFLQLKVIEHMSRISVRLGERIRTLLKERLSGLPATESERVWHECNKFLLDASYCPSLESPAKMAGKMPAQPTHPAALGTTGRHVEPAK